MTTKRMGTSQNAVSLTMSGCGCSLNDLTQSADLKGLLLPAILQKMLEQDFTVVLDLTSLRLLWQTYSSMKFTTTM
jgi:hypothetical protein